MRKARLKARGSKQRPWHQYELKQKCEENSVDITNAKDEGQERKREHHPVMGNRKKFVKEPEEGSER